MDVDANNNHIPVAKVSQTPATLLLLVLVRPASQTDPGTNTTAPISVRSWGTQAFLGRSMKILKYYLPTAHPSLLAWVACLAAQRHMTGVFTDTGTKRAKIKL